MGYTEGLGAGVNLIVSYLAPEVVRSLTVYSLDIGMQAKDISAATRQHFAAVAWAALGIETLEDVTIADDPTIRATQATSQHGDELIAAIDSALPVFNLSR
jgi:hypothetical protein